MTSLTPEVAEQLHAAYRAMAQARYRPAAPGDGCGNITVPLEDLDLEDEARRYAEAWWTEEDDMSFTIGCAHYPTRRALVYCVEAARLLCAGRDGMPWAAKLLRLAIRELARVRKEEEEA